jgi:hypothetical protein
MLIYVEGSYLTLSTPTRTPQLLSLKKLQTSPLDIMQSPITMSTLSKFFTLLGMKASEASRPIASSSSRADLGPPREMGYMVYDYSQASAFISLEEAQNSRTIALRSLNHTQTSGTLDLTMLQNEQSWPSAYGLVSLKEAQNNKAIARRAIYLL